MIATILLAAGSGRRFGGDKLLEDLNGKPLIRWAAEGLAAVAPDGMLVVVPPADIAIRAALKGLDLRFVPNERAAEGMGTSIAAGVAALDASVEAALIALADVPFGPAVVLPAVVSRFRRTGASIVAPTYRGVPGHPVLFARSVFPELLDLSGDRGARAVVERDSARVETVAVNADAPDDVDTREDLARLEG